MAHLKNKPSKLKLTIPTSLQVAIGTQFLTVKILCQIDKLKKARMATFWLQQFFCGTNSGKKQISILAQAFLIY